MPKSVDHTIQLDINYSDTIKSASLETYQLDIQDTQLKPILKSTLELAAKKYTDLQADKPINISLYLVEAEEGKQLNQSFRGKDYATNVLSFPSDIAKELPFDLIDALDTFPLGELIICLPVVACEAAEQGKSTQHHFIHLMVHGCLHLLGYDHELSELVSEADAETMEALEVKILEQLGITNPYLTTF